MNNIARIQAELSARGMAALLITDGISREFALGLETSAGMALITPQKGFFMVDFRYYEAAKRALPECEIIMTSKDNSYYMIINRLCGDMRLRRLSFEDKKMTVADHKLMASKLDAGLIPAGDMLERLRAGKQPFEIERIKQAQKIAERTLDRVCSFIRPGARDIDIKAEIEYRLAREGCAPAFDTIVAVGKNSSMPHAKADGVIINEGDFVTVDMGARYGGYCSDMTRTFAVARADDEMKKIYDIVLTAQAAALKVARTGVPYLEVDCAARRIIDSAGYGEYFGHGLGHGVGMEVHEDLFASAAEGGLKENSILTFEPGIYLEGRFGVRIEDFGAITRDGVDNFTCFPKELIVLGA